MNSTKRKLPCRSCGKSFTAISPDSIHTDAKLEKPNKEEIEGEIKERPEVCKNCGHRNTVYWFHYHRTFD
jgi:DNA-directed RNA polymerase subunit M/transcription elongation factor TFIIS